LTDGLSGYVDRHKLWWIGLYDIADVKSYTWLDGELLLYSNMKSEQPGARQQQCVAFNIETAQWEEQLCNLEITFICKKSVGMYTFMI